MDLERMIMLFCFRHERPGGVDIEARPNVKPPSLETRHASPTLVASSTVSLIYSRRHGDSAV